MKGPAYGRGTFVFIFLCEDCGGHPSSAPDYIMYMLSLESKNTQIVVSRNRIRIYFTKTPIQNAQDTECFTYLHLIETDFFRDVKGCEG